MTSKRIFRGNGNDEVSLPDPKPVPPMPVPMPAPEPQPKVASDMVEHAWVVPAKPAEDEVAA